MADPSQPDLRQAILNDFKPTPLGGSQGLISLPEINIFQSLKSQDNARQAAGYSLPYRVLAPMAQFMGADVSGAEASAKSGSTAGILGHLGPALLPVLLSLLHGGAPPPEQGGTPLASPKSAVANEGAVDAATRGASEAKPVTTEALKGELDNLHEKWVHAATTGERMKVVEQIRATQDKILALEGKPVEAVSERSSEAIAKQVTRKMGQPRPQTIADVANPARDTNVFQSIQKAHPDWSISQVAMEAAKQVKGQK